MENWQRIIVLVYLIFSILGLLDSYRTSIVKKNNYGSTHMFVLLGAFFSADLLVFSVFWILFSLFSLLANDFTLFLLGIALFWTVRSFGEIQYWLNEQFSKIDRNPKIPGFFKRLVGDDLNAYWFTMQIIWQCLLVIFLLASIYLARQWLVNFS